MYDWSDLLELYSSGMNPNQIAKLKGCTRSTVCIHLAHAGIPEYKKHLEAKRESNIKFRMKWARQHNGCPYQTVWNWNNPDKKYEHDRTYAEKFKAEHGMHPSTYYRNGHHVLKRIVEGEHKVIRLENINGGRKCHPVAK